MNIGIFAGTFDPIHDGHIAFAQAAIEEAGLDRVIIVAEKEPYRKKPFASWDHRQAMIERATENVSQVDHDYNFAGMLARQHTMQDMLEAAKKHYGSEHDYWFLVGSDIFEHIHKWEKLANVEQYKGFLVALRGDHTEEWVRDKQAQVSSIGINSTLIISNHQPTISSSKVRSAIEDGQHPTGIAPNVSEYIQAHNLYA